MKQLNTALKTVTSSRSFSIFSSNSWWEMCLSGNRTRSVWPSGKYRFIRHTKISEIQTGIFGRMERAPRFLPQARSIVGSEDENGCLKEHNHAFAHAQVFDFWTGGQEFKDARIDIELSQIRWHRSQSTLALP